MGDTLTQDLFAGAADGPGSLSIDMEICAVIGAALDAAHARGLDRERIAERLSFYAGEKVGVNSLNDWSSPAHQHHRITLARAAAFDAAVGGDPLLTLLAAKRGLHVVTGDDMVLLELGRLQHEERERAEHRRALETLLKIRKKS